MWISAGKFLLLVILLNVVRYALGGPLEAILIMNPMHAVMPKFPDCFRTDFTDMDFAVSFFYNFMLWLSATWIFLVGYRSVSGTIMIRSLKLYGIGCLFFISLAAVYMNHYNDEIGVFYLYSMLDAVILFLIVGAANGILFPILYKTEVAKLFSEGHE